WVLDREGSVRRHVLDREVQFAAFTTTGAGAIVEIRDAGLWLRLRLPGGRFRSIQLDDAFPASLDFAQDIAFGEPDDEVLGVVQRWSGIYHAFSKQGAVETGRLPAGDGGLYYTGVSAGGRVCGTLCRKEPAILCEGPLR
ncbi:MAG: hypothetical protein HKP27_00460, partial [Myxococcales bacterium]|nr:hypothetical protein [Myxococcales bacterium]